MSSIPARRRQGQGCLSHNNNNQLADQPNKKPNPKAKPNKTRAGSSDRMDRGLKTGKQTMDLGTSLGYKEGTEIKPEKDPARSRRTELCGGHCPAGARQSRVPAPDPGEAAQ